MTMTPGEVERKVRQLDNDVQSIYEMLASISAQQSRHLNRLNALDTKIDTRCDALDAKLEAHDAKLDAHDGRFASLDAKLIDHDSRFATIDTKLDQILERLA